MDYTLVESSNIHSVGWANEKLCVRFHHGKEYVYEGVPHDVYVGMLQAPSAGKYLNAEVKPRFTVSAPIPYEVAAA